MGIPIIFFVIGFIAYSKLIEIKSPLQGPKNLDAFIDGMTVGESHRMTIEADGDVELVSPLLYYPEEEDDEIAATNRSAIYMGTITNTSEQDYIHVNFIENVKVLEVSGFNLQ